MEIEEATELMCREDEKECRAVQKKAKEANENLDQFVADFTETKSKLRAELGAGDPAAKGKGAGKGKGKGKGRGVAAGAPPKPKAPAPDVIDIETANKLKPPHSYLWRAFAHQAWEGRLPPFKTISEPWAHYDNTNQALFAVVKRLWAQHCMVEAIPTSECPIDGLFP